MKLIVLLEPINMTLEYSSVINVGEANGAVYKRTICPSCSGDKRTLFERVCRLCQGSGEIKEAVLVHENSKRTD